MVKFRWWFLIPCCFAGYFLGNIFLKKLPELPLKFNHPLNQFFGVHKTSIIGFLPYWLLSEASADYSPYLTNLTYFGLAVNGDGSISQKNNKNETEPGFAKFNSVKLNKNLESSLLLYAADKNSIDNLIKNPESSAKKLVSEVIPLMKKKGYTDLNIDLETLRIATPDEQTAFTKFLTIVSSNIKKSHFSLTICLPVAAFSYPTIISPIQIQPLVDRVVVMTYDYSYRGSVITGPTAPFNEVESTIKIVLPTFRSEQIIVGIPLYSYQWETLKNSSEAPIIPGSGQTLTSRKIVNLLTACDNCQLQSNSSTQETSLIYPDIKTGSNYQTYIPSQNSFNSKIDLVKKYHLGGVAFWALGYEPEKYLTPFSSLKTFSWRD